MARKQTRKTRARTELTDDDRFLAYAIGNAVSGAARYAADAIVEAVNKPITEAIYEAIDKRLREAIAEQILAARTASAK